jgi:uncharacterized phage protein (TIGR01671 family)
MREIKFRVWDKKNKRFISPTFMKITGIGRVWITENGDYSLNVINDIELLQFTGLYDKNGKEIYEGDIILYQVNDNYKCKAIVSWNIDGFILMWQDKTSPNNLSDFWCENTEVIGNVYENPELLNEETI